MKRLFLLFAFFVTIVSNAQNNGSASKSMGTSCHEISISIVGIVTINDFYVCCGDGFVDNTTVPPTVCKRVSKKLFDILQAGGAKYSNGEGEVSMPKINDLTSEDISGITEITVNKSSISEISGLKYSVRTGIYKIEQDGIINFEIIQLK